MNLAVLRLHRFECLQYSDVYAIQLIVYLQRSVVILLLACLTVVYAFKLDGNPFYEIGCMKQCGSYFSTCYKQCFTTEEEAEVAFEKRSRACLDGCIMRLTMCNHYCSKWGRLEIYTRTIHSNCMFTVGSITYNINMK